MNLEQLQSFFGWCTLINTGLLTAWFLMYWFGRDMIYQIHGSIFNLSADRLNTIQYSAMAFYKLSIILFNLVPYIALLLMR